MRNLMDEWALVEHMPMAFNALVIEYTTRCNARCGMCYQSAGPKGSDLLGKATLSAKTIERVIRESAAIETIVPRLHITGGEGFLDEDLLLSMIDVGCQVGFRELTTTTNAFWARTPQAAHATCVRARKAGLTSMEISWDRWHEPFIDAAVVSHALEACFDTGIDAHLRILSSRAHTFEEALVRLRPEAVALATQISCGPILPTGRAATDIPDADMCDQGSPDDACHGSLNLTVNAAGNVAPCCAGLDQTSAHVFGNVHQMHMDEIVGALNGSLLARILVFRGPAVLGDLLAEVGQALPGPHHGICHQCWSIFSDAQRVKAIEVALDQRRDEGLRQAIAALRSTAEVPHAKV
jgi:hypothetical protein